MIAALINCAIALAILLVVASLPFGAFGQKLRHLGLGIFFGVFGLCIVAEMLRTLLPVMLSDWRFYLFWLIASPIAYLVLETRKQTGKAGKQQRANPPKRRDGDVAQERRDDGEQVF